MRLPEGDAVRLRHMLDYAQKTLEFTKSKKRADFDSDEMLALAIIHLIEIIGEASKSVSEEFRYSHPEIPWFCLWKIKYHEFLSEQIGY